MRILILSWRGPKHPNAGGAEIVTLEHAKAWVKADHKVTLFTSLFNGAQTEEVIEGVLIIRRGGAALSVKFQALSWYLFENKERFDLVVDEFHGIPFFTPLYVRTKKVAFIHEVSKNVWFSNLIWPVASIGFMLEPWIFRFYRNIPFMTVSESTKSDLINFGIASKNITVIHNGITVPQVKKTIKKEGKPTLIFLGALSRDKGIEDAVEVFALLEQKGRNFQYWVVGKGNGAYINYLKERCTKLCLDGKVHFWGFVDEDKKFELLARSHILINPSIREGWGLVVMEAASVGTPTVGYSVAGLKDSVINNITGILCTLNPQSLAKGISMLLSNGIFYQRMVKNCLQWSNKFSWEKSTKESLNYIEVLVQKS